MRLLLDTHVLIWWDVGARLSTRADRAIREAEQVYVSAASGWEVAIKTALGKLDTDRLVSDVAADSGFEELSIRLSHTEAIRDLPRHHRDPFDRLLVAQARAEGLTLVTRDRVFDAYDVRVLRA